jgi:hypothetical protein
LARVLSTAFLVVLLAATAAAFAATEGAKLELSPIYRTQVPVKVFSPGVNVAPIDFRLRKTDHLTVWMNSNGKRVVTIVRGRTYRPGWVRLEFDGISDRGLTLPDGTYVPVVHLGRSHRTIRLPNPIEIDTVPPKITVPHRVYTHISPDGDKHNDVFRVPYTLDGPAHAILSVRGIRVERTRSQETHGVLEWNGKLGGRVVAPGNYVLRASAEDAAGNVSKPFAFAVVTVRFVVLGRTRILARPGGRFAVLVLADAPRVTWLFARARGSVPTGHGRTTLHLRAPRKRGVYRLYVEASGHAAKALVVVA